MPKIGDICKFQSGGTPSKNNQSFYGGQIPWITTVSLTGDYIDGTSAVEWITDEAIKSSAAKIVPPNSIMIGTRVGIGKTAINRVKMSTSQDIVSLINIDEHKWNKQYLCFYFQSKREYLLSQSRGATIKGIKIETLFDLALPELSIDDQTQIVTTLSTLQALITHRNQQLAKLDELVKARFVEMFGEPIDNPMGWQIKPLKELSTLITNGNTPKGGSENYVDSGIIFLRSQNVWRNRIDLSDVAYIDEATNQKMRKSIVKHKDILITKTGRINTENSSLGRAALYLGEDDSANINGHVYLVRLNDSVVPEFVVTILTGEAYRKYIRKVCVGGIDKRQINLDQVEDFPIILPPIEQQRTFADFSIQIDKSKFIAERTITTIRRVRLHDQF